MHLLKCHTYQQFLLQESREACSIYRSNPILLLYSTHVHNLQTSLFYPCAETFKEGVRTICPLHYYKGTKKEMVMMKSNSHDTFVLDCLELWLVMSGCILTLCLLSVCSSKISSTFCGLLTSKSEDDKDFSRYFCQLKDLVNKQIKCVLRCLAHFVF